MLCERNDDITNNALFIACIAVCEKVNTPWIGRSVDAARAQRGNSLAFRKRRSESVGDWCNGKGIQSANFRYDSVFSKCKRSLFARPRSIDAASVQIL